MQLTVNNKNALELDNNVVKKLLSIYPEEELFFRPVFKSAFENDFIKFIKLKEECDKICIPWQMFFLSYEKLNTQLKHIEEQREYKVSGKVFSKRRGQGNITSKRIVDRLIRQQNFVIENGRYNKNPLCGFIKENTIKDAAKKLKYFFEIDHGYLWKLKNKQTALTYLIEKVQAKNVNVCRGVLTNKILPQINSAKSVYKNTSGFVIRDERVPFVFLPGEVNPAELEGRQIYTLFFLMTCIGLDEYNVTAQVPHGIISLPKESVCDSLRL